MGRGLCLVLHYGTSDSKDGLDVVWKRRKWSGELSDALSACALPTEDSVTLKPG